MQNDLNFLPRLQMRDMARDAYRLMVRNGVGLHRKVNGVDYNTEVNFELEAVFIHFQTPTGEPKVSVHAIQKGW